MKAELKGKATGSGSFSWRVSRLRRTAVRRSPGWKSDGYGRARLRFKFSGKRSQEAHLNERMPEWQSVRRSNVAADIMRNPAAARLASGMRAGPCEAGCRFRTSGKQRRTEPSAPPRGEHTEPRWARVLGRGGRVVAGTGPASPCGTGWPETQSAGCAENPEAGCGSENGG